MPIFLLEETLFNVHLLHENDFKLIQQRNT